MRLKENSVHTVLFIAEIGGNYSSRFCIERGGVLQSLIESMIR